MDVVANLIGILIILVMLVGSQAQSVWEELRARRNEDDPETTQLKESLGSAGESVAKLKSENRELENQIQKQAHAAETMKRERDRLEAMIEIRKSQLVEKQKSLDEATQKKQLLVSTASDLESELTAIEGKIKSLTSVQPKTRIIDHLPTPIAQTVFGEEIHFRLSGGKLVYVPLNELVELMRSEWRVKAKKLVQTSSTIETVGPVSDFRLQYKLVLREEVQRTEEGVVKLTMPGLERFVLIPTREDLGEPVAVALQPESQFSGRIRSLNPRDYTISVWVYPDSFGEFNQVKKHLHRLGFLCAGWPLPEDQPISGSPNGFRTAAQ